MNFLVLLSIFGTAKCANILGVFMFPSIAHQVVFQEIWRELSLRGHQVTVVTPNPLNDPTLTNLTEISVQSAYNIERKYEGHCREMEEFYHYLDAVADHQLNSTQFQGLISGENYFDLVLIEIMHPVMYALGNFFDAPVIGVSSGNIFSVYYDAVGNPNHPVLYPDPIFDFTPGKLTLVEKFQSIYFFLWNKFYYHYVFVPRAHKMAEKYFGSDILPLGDMERNVSMYFLNTNLLVHPARANVPAIVDISPIDTNPPKLLPKSLKKMLDEAKEGVVYVSLGLNFTSMSHEKRTVILQALSELPYKFLVKAKSEFLPETPSNVISKAWFPEKELLAHRNVRVFVTQPELYLVERAISAQVPLVCLPFFRSQQPLARRVVKLGVGATLRINDLTKHSIKDVIVKVAEMKAYKTKMVEANDIFFDKPMTGLESAVWWAEYVIRYKGARHLRSAAIDMPWYQYLLLDVLLFLMVLIGLYLYLTVKMVLCIPKLCKFVMKSRSREVKEKDN